MSKVNESVVRGLILVFLTINAVCAVYFGAAGAWRVALANVLACLLGVVIAMIVQSRRPPSLAAAGTMLVLVLAFSGVLWLL